MVGSALVRLLEKEEDNQLVYATREELDLRRQSDVENFVEEHRPDLMIVAAARVGGIYANNTYPADFLRDNLLIAANLIHAAHLCDVERVLYLGSSCVYPKHADQPIKESALLSGPLEPTNEGYAVAKIAGLKLCEFYRKQYGRIYHSAMPCNLYGPGDNYHPENSHVIPAMIRRFHEAKESGADKVVIWGTGSPKREFLYVDDLADACVHLCGIDEPPPLINIGAGSDLTIRDLAQLVAEVVGFGGEIGTDPSQPDGTPRKLMDSTKIREMGWEPKTSLKEGIGLAYRDFIEHGDIVRG